MTAGSGRLEGVLQHAPQRLQRNVSLGPDISPLSVLVEPVDANILHIKIGTPGRYEVPQEAIFMNTGMGEDTNALPLQDDHKALQVSMGGSAQCIKMHHSAGVMHDHHQLPHDYTEMSSRHETAHQMRSACCRKEARKEHLQPEVHSCPLWLRCGQSQRNCLCSSSLRHRCLSNHVQGKSSLLRGDTNPVLRVLAV